MPAPARGGGHVSSSRSGDTGTTRPSPKNLSRHPGAISRFCPSAPARTGTGTGRGATLAGADVPAPDEVLGDAWLRAVHPEDSAGAGLAFARAPSESASPSASRFGSPRPASGRHTSTDPVQSAGGRRWNGVVFDLGGVLPVSSRARRSGCGRERDEVLRDLDEIGHAASHALKEPLGDQHPGRDPRGRPRRRARRRCAGAPARDPAARAADRGPAQRHRGARAHPPPGPEPARR